MWYEVSPEAPGEETGLSASHGGSHPYGDTGCPNLRWSCTEAQKNQFAQTHPEIVQ
jgi:hypothetical protein